MFKDFSEVCEMEETGGADLARGLALALSEENPRFDRERFLKACGV